MHYYVDGYNLLFRLGGLFEKKSLEISRACLISHLDNLAKLLNLECTIVFDAAFQSNELSRGHFGSLEIIFTAKDETADSHLIEIFDAIEKPGLAVCVTSDRELKSRAKMRHIRTLSCEEFLSSLHKKAAKKKKKEKIPTPQIEEKIPPRRIQRKWGEKELPPLDDLAAWEALFLERLGNNKKAPPQ
jgi:predicted RNA-binding protein with PIN domain